MKTVASLFAGVNSESIFESIYLNRWVILGSFGFAFLLSYFFSFFLQYCTWFMVALSIVGIYGLGIFLSILSWRRYKEIQSQETTPDTEEKISSSARFYKYLAIGLWSLLAILFMAIVCLFNRIKLAVKVIQAAADFVSDYKEVIFVPVVLVLVAVAYLAYWVYGLACIYSTGEVYHNPNYPWGKIKWSDGLK